MRTCEARPPPVTKRCGPILGWLLAFALCGGLVTSCSNEGADASGSTVAQLPPLRFTDETPSLMLTWIDERGDTHVESNPSEVPAEHARYVRVLVADSNDGARDPIYVADVARPDADGGYTAHGISRAEWEQEIKRRRVSPGDGVANDDGRSPPSRHRPRPPGADAQPPDPALDPSVGAAAIVYGTSWCGACHQAREHLRKKGVKTVFKDVDKDAAGRAEMVSKLEKRGGRPGSIPVIDVGGELIVGYSARAIDEALGRPAGASRGRF